MENNEIMDVTLVCESFPSVPKDIINREHLIDTLDNLFDERCQTIVVEAKAGYGKTIFLAQIAQKYAHTTISIFIRPGNSYGYDPNLIMYDLCNQLNWILYRTELQNSSQIDEAFMKSKFFELHKSVKKNRKYIYFVIDGLEHIPSENSLIKNSIIQMLPLNREYFRFIFSSFDGSISSFLDDSIKLKSLTLPNFSINEFNMFFNEVSIENNTLESLYKICKGVPEKFASIKRTINSGLNPEDIIFQIDNQMANLFEIEWKQQINEENLNLMEFLALVAFDKKQNDSIFYANLLKISGENIENMVDEITFLSKDSSNRIYFISEEIKKLVAKKLSHQKASINDKLISYFLNDPDSELSIENLPNYLEQAGKFEELLNYLSPEVFGKMLSYAQSLYSIQYKTEKAISIADSLSKQGDLMRFCLNNSLIKQNNGPKIWISEIEARMQLNDYGRVLALAQSTNLLEERLHMFTVIAKIKKEQGLSPDLEILEEIKSLYLQIDYRHLGNRAIVIASNLLYCFPELGIELMEKLSGAWTGKRENELDWALATLSLAAMNSAENTKIDTEFSETLRDIRERIKSPEIKKFSTEASILISDYNSIEVLKEVEKLDSNTDKLYFLGHWARGSKKKVNVENVLDYALNLIVNKATYSPNASVYVNIAQLIAHTDSSQSKQKYIDVFDVQMESIKDSGPTEDVISLQLVLAENESDIDKEKAFNRLIEIYFYINEIKDIETKMGALAMLLRGTIRIDQEMILEERDGFHELVKNELDENLVILFSISAEQIHCLKSIIKTLGSIDTHFILKVIEKINTESKRNVAYSMLIDSLLSDEISNINFEHIKNLLKKITNPDFVNEAIYDIANVVSEQIVQMDKAKFDSAISLLFDISKITESELRCVAYSKILNVLNNYEHQENLYEKFKLKLKESWECIDIGWRKVDIGFKIISELSSNSLELAKEYLDLNEKFRNKISLDDPNGSWTFISALKLTIRGYSGLINSNNNTEQDIDKIYALIDVIPSCGEKARLYSELAICLFLNSRISEAQEIIQNYVKCNLDAISHEDKRYRYFVINNISVSLYLDHKLSAFEIINQLPRFDRDISYLKICEFIMRKTLPSNPYDEVHGQAYKLTYAEVLDICEILDKIDLDSIIYEVIKMLTTSLGSRDLFTKQQNASIVQKLNGIIESKLPNHLHIQHNGFKIVCLANIWKVDRNKIKNTWNDLLCEANAIPNLSDKIFVKSILLACLNRKEFDKNKELLEEIEEEIEKVPIMLDKIQCLEAMSNEFVDIDTMHSKRYLKKAMELTLIKENDEINSAQRRIIDFAHRLDPDLANSLVSLTDDDNARKQANLELNKQLEVLELRKKMLDRKKSEKKSEHYTSEQYIRASHRLLASLNAGRIETIKFEQIKEYLLIASKNEFGKNYITYAWIVENIVKKYSNTKEVSTQIRPIFEACLIATEVSLKLSSKSMKQIQKMKLEVKSIDESSIFIKIGEREKAIQFIKNWLIKNLGNTLKICEPYFGPEDLEVLQLVQSVNPDCEVEILTSKKHQLEIKNSLESSYQDYWRIHLSDQDPPFTKIVVVGNASQNILPIHDRWWITDNSGIRLGTSFNSLGKRETEMSILTKDENELRGIEISKYLNMAIKDHAGERLSYNSFTL
ncbi:hypothetical protein [Paenibacillus bovis]|uniref:Uncharacterized protein n=1 Tax=Paenibacillus bovis TaxID=1616788 RepID=A0A172ZCZ5_9BACL|nr:hypothetical protein [Paenibacillus bovis]ANF95515.1 hypothetical protein AR543_05495 [Paenibacillus bovis]